MKPHTWNPMGPSIQKYTFLQQLQSKIISSIFTVELCVSWISSGQCISPLRAITTISFYISKILIQSRRLIETCHLKRDRWSTVRFLLRPIIIHMVQHSSSSEKFPNLHVNSEYTTRYRSFEISKFKKVVAYTISPLSKKAKHDENINHFTTKVQIRSESI